MTPLQPSSDACTNNNDECDTANRHARWARIKEEDSECVERIRKNCGVEKEMPRDRTRGTLLSVSASAERMPFFITGPGFCFIFHSQRKRLSFGRLSLRTGWLSRLRCRPCPLGPHPTAYPTAAGLVSVRAIGSYGHFLRYLTTGNKQRGSLTLLIPVPVRTRQNPRSMRLDPIDHLNGARRCRMADVGPLSWLNHKTVAEHRTSSSCC